MGFPNSWLKYQSYKVKPGKSSHQRTFISGDYISGMKFVENYAKIGVSDQLGLLCKDTSIKVCPLSLLANILCVT